MPDGPVGVISDAAIASAARAQGLNPTNTAIAVAIALAESGGNTRAHNAVPPDNSYGLWQINMLGSMGPERRKQFGLTSNDQLYDPNVNAKAMSAISNGGTNWKPWTTYTRGTYRAYMARGMQAAGSSSGTPGTIETQPVGLSDSFSSITQFFNTLQDVRFWKWFGLMLVGAGLAFYGVMKMTGDNQLSAATKGLVKGAVGLIPGGGTVVQGAKAVKGAMR